MTYEGMGRANSVTTDTYAPIFDEFTRAPSSYDNVRVPRAIALRHAGFISDLELLTAEEHATNDIYQKLLRPHGIEWAAGTVITTPTFDCLAFEFGTKMESGPFTRERLDRLDLYRPHLARAGLISARLGLERARGMADTIGSVGLAAAILDRGGRVLATNSRFESLAPRVEIVARDQVFVANKSAAGLLRQSIEQNATQKTPNVASIPVPAVEDHHALIIHIIPVRRAAHDVFFGAASMLVVTSVTAPSAPLAELLNGLFDLSPAEARVARLLSEGDSVTTAAGRLSLSRETIRSHLKAVMSKTGVSRQADLARLLAATTSQIRVEQT
ncbi:helix-turn-helix transcriptional regulator (plasmid) [Rhizobium sp. CB3171]|uniref:helix-turn-helix transcriptional regulator n=1 Tax=Rhizobium sp. CB3171 TaxID=3039157 RepID=UPI0024B205B3|nr:helix-turn-helix transcriptional regulator [Rhizobium sp. CB3171]WFU07441.1 helix-turn-helix transcriptional regulator [Rhizobium sp. CB3171]